MAEEKLVESLADLKQRFPLMQNVNVIHHQELSLLDRLALFVTEKIRKIRKEIILV